VHFSALLVLTTKVRQTTLHSITDIMAVVAAADIMDMDKAECPISRILPVRHPRCRDNNNTPSNKCRRPLDGLAGLFEADSKSHQIHDEGTSEAVALL
jgi:hypothetical protein